MKYDVIIVGAGASGMMAAITAASHHKKVLLLERMDKLGKKILATGNGRCNLSNAYMDENCYRGQRPSFAYPMIEEFGLEDLIQFFGDQFIIRVDADITDISNSRGVF